MKLIAIFGAGLALTLSGCGSSDDEGGPSPPFPNAVTPANHGSSSASDSEEEGSSEDSSDTASADQYEGTSVEGMSVAPTVNPSDSSEVNSEASADDPSAEQASDSSDGQ